VACRHVSRTVCPGKADVYSISHERSQEQEPTDSTTRRVELPGASLARKDHKNRPIGLPEERIGRVYVIRHHSTKKRSRSTFKRAWSLARQVSQKSIRASGVSETNAGRPARGRSRRFRHSMGLHHWSLDPCRSAPYPYGGWSSSSVGCLDHLWHTSRKLYWSVCVVLCWGATYMSAVFHLDSVPFLSALFKSPSTRSFLCRIPKCYNISFSGYIHPSIYQSPHPIQKSSRSRCNTLPLRSLPSLPVPWQHRRSDSFPLAPMTR